MHNSQLPRLDKNRIKVRSITRNRFIVSPEYLVLENDIQFARNSHNNTVPESRPLRRARNTEQTDETPTQTAIKIIKKANASVNEAVKKLTESMVNQNTTNESIETVNETSGETTVDDIADDLIVVEEYLIEESNVDIEMQQDEGFSDM